MTRGRQGKGKGAHREETPTTKAEWVTEVFSTDELLLSNNTYKARVGEEYRRDMCRRSLRRLEYENGLEAKKSSGDYFLLCMLQCNSHFRWLGGRKGETVNK